MSKPPADNKTRRAKRARPARRESGVADLFDGALAASVAQRHDEAVGMLVSVLQREPSHARARHLLGAEYAQAGKIDDAILEIAIALELAPGMSLARFQLGLLLLTSGKVDQAAAVWAPLEALGAEHVLNLFKNGMLRMAAGDFDAARAALTAALAENTELPVLNGELATALKALDQAQAASAQAARTSTQVDEPAAADQAADGDHILVSTYGGDAGTHRP